MAKGNNKKAIMRRLGKALAKGETSHLEKHMWERCYYHTDLVNKNLYSAVEITRRMKRVAAGQDKSTRSRFKVVSLERVLKDGIEAIPVGWHEGVSLCEYALLHYKGESRIPVSVVVVMMDIGNRIVSIVLCRNQALFKINLGHISSDEEREHPTNPFQFPHLHGILYNKLSRFVDANYVPEVRYSAGGGGIRFSREPSVDYSIDVRKEKTCTANADDVDDDFSAIFNIFNTKKTPSESRVEKVEKLVAAAEKKDKFSASMMHIIAAKGLTDAQVYNNVFMDRRLFNKIRNNPDYQPSKRTAILIAVSLKLTYEETQSLLETAGYTLTHSNKFDLIVEFFIREGNYDVFEINEMLEHFRQPLLTKCE